MFQEVARFASVSFTSRPLLSLLFLAAALVRQLTRPMELTLTLW